MSAVPPRSAMPLLPISLALAADSAAGRPAGACELRICAPSDPHRPATRCRRCRRRRRVRGRATRIRRRDCPTTRRRCLRRRTRGPWRGFPDRSRRRWAGACSGGGIQMWPRRSTATPATAPSSQRFGSGFGHAGFDRKVGTLDCCLLRVPAPVMADSHRSGLLLRRQLSRIRRSVGIAVSFRSRPSGKSSAGGPVAARAGCARFTDSIDRGMCRAEGL